MSMEPIQATFIVGLVAGVVIAGVAGAPGWPVPFAQWLVAIAVAVLLSAAHAYSPLTDVSGTMLMPASVGGGYWGFSPPDDEGVRES